MVTRDGLVLGSFCEIDIESRGSGRQEQIDILRDLTASAMTEVELRLAPRMNCSQANRAKDRFLAMLSHELRTPFSPAAMMTAASVAVGSGLPERLREDVELIHRNINQRLNPVIRSDG